MTGFDRAFLGFPQRIAPFAMQLDGAGQVDFRDGRRRHKLTETSSLERFGRWGVGVQNADI